MFQQGHTFEAQITKTVHLNYLLFLPKDYGGNPEEKWPLILFLHGSGEMGDDLELVKKHGIPKLVEMQENFPFIAVSPQCPKDSSGWTDEIEGLTEAKELDLDLIALTGDIIHFPSQASIECARRSIDKVEVPVLYVCGNHDWHFPGLEGREELREAWWPVLKPLYRHHAAYDRHEIGGIQFLLVDDSTYQVSEKQLTFVKSHLANGMPTVLLTHIPVSLPTLRHPTIERWKAPILIGDPDWELESRNRWGTDGDLSSTLEFVGTLATSRNLVAVFCGHIHFPHTDAISPNAVQFVGAPGYAAERRLVEFRPLSF